MASGYQLIGTVAFTYEVDTNSSGSEVGRLSGNISSVQNANQRSTHFNFIKGKLAVPDQAQIGVSYFHKMHKGLLKREVSLDDMADEIKRKGGKICLGEYGITDALSQPTECLEVLNNSFSLGDILEVTYLSGNDIAVVSSDLFAGNAIISGKVGSRTVTALKGIKPFKQVISELDMDGITSVSGTSAQFTLGFAANWGGNVCCNGEMPIPTPTAGQMTLTRKSSTP